MSEIKVTDLTKGWTSKDNQEVLKLMHQLDELVQEYAELPPDSNDIQTLERIKRSMTGLLQRYSVLYSKVRSYFEGSSYLDGIRKQIKSEAISHIIENSEGETSASAERQVYSSDYYKKRYELLIVLRERFIGVDDKYRRYIQAERNIGQTISLLNKEYTNQV